MSVSISPRGSISRLIASGSLRTVFQRIVDLDSGKSVGFEALARGPAGTELEMPAALFATAEREGVMPELDRACRQRALEHALDARLDPSQLLFVNVEPAGLDHGGVLEQLAEGSLGRLAVVVELTERALTSRPSEVLAAVRWLRRRKCRIALDDIGVDERSLALMPFIAPDVIKLDMRLAQDRLPARHAARIVNAVGAEAERSGAVILAEGIETSADRRRAQAMGATLGQGWLLGRPGSLNAKRASQAEAALPEQILAAGSAGTPFEVIADQRRLRRGDKRLLLALSRQLEREALSLAGEAVVVASFQDARFFDDRTRRRYERLADRAALVGALGVGMEETPGVGIRGAALAADASLRGEWNVIVISPHFSGGFVARDLGDRGGDLDRRFDYFVTYDRALVSRAARRLLERIVPTL